MTAWRKSTRSGSDVASDCVEVAALPDVRLGIRDSKDPSGPYLSLTPNHWHGLLTRIKTGALDLSD